TLVTKDNAALNDDLKLLFKIKVAINYDSFWDFLVILYDLLYLFCKAFNFMQHNKTHLHNVLYTFGFFIKIFKELEESQFRTKMIEKLEKRWATWKQLLLLLSFVLHSLYQLDYLD
ncbi:7068_t:CDS:1, partial [Cetraspora pellucida]